MVAGMHRTEQRFFWILFAMLNSAILGDEPRRWMLLEYQKRFAWGVSVKNGPELGKNIFNFSLSCSILGRASKTSQSCLINKIVVNWTIHAVEHKARTMTPKIDLKRSNIACSVAALKSHSKRQNVRSRIFLQAC